MKKSPYVGKKRMGADMALQITSMADIFTIILVFLLKNYATSVININPAHGLTLPRAASAGAQVVALKIEIVPDAVSVEDTPVLELNQFRFDPKDLQAGGVPLPLREALKQQKKRQVLIAKANRDVKEDSKVLVVADRKAPYGTLKSVLAAAALEGYADFNLVVEKKD